MIAAAKWLRPRKLRSSLSCRTSNLRKRLNQLCATSTIQRRHTGACCAAQVAWGAAPRWRQGPRSLDDIMSIGSGHDERERDATTVHRQVALAPISFPDQSVSARRLREPAVPSSSPRRYSAIAMRCLQSRRTLPVQPSTGLAHIVLGRLATALWNQRLDPFQESIRHDPRRQPTFRCTFRHLRSPQV